jgi:recombination protein RecA
MSHTLDDILKKDLGLQTGVAIPVQDWVSTGHAGLDWAVSGKLTGGGLPVGRVVDIYGDPSTGKSLLIMHILAETQKKGGIAILDDTEGAYNRFFAEMIGVNTENLFLLDSVTIEEHFENVKKIIEKVRHKDKDVMITIALDSLACLSTKHELKEGFDKVDMTKAKMIRQGMRILGNTFREANVLYIVANHVIAKIGQMYGPKKTTPGGSGVPFQSSVRIELKKKANIAGANDVVSGVNIEAEIKKNKVAPPFKQTAARVYFDKGIEKYSGIVPILMAEGIVTQPSQGWYEAFGEKKREKDIEAMAEDLLLKGQSNEAKDK